MTRMKCPHGISPKSNCDICRKEYNKKYSQSPKYKESQRRYYKSLKRKEYIKRYQQSPKYKEYQRKYRQLKKKMEASLK